MWWPVEFTIKGLAPFTKRSLQFCSNTSRKYLEAWKVWPPALYTELKASATVIISVSTIIDIHRHHLSKKLRICSPLSRLVSSRKRRREYDQGIRDYKILTRLTVLWGWWHFKMTWLCHRHQAHPKITTHYQNPEKARIVHASLRIRRKNHENNMQQGLQFVSTKHFLS